jgi:hypothetical protein
MAGLTFPNRFPKRPEMVPNLPGAFPELPALPLGEREREGFREWEGVH